MWGEKEEKRRRRRKVMCKRREGVKGVRLPEQRKEEGTA